MAERSKKKFSSARHAVGLGVITTRFGAQVAGRTAKTAARGAWNQIHNPNSFANRGVGFAGRTGLGATKGAVKAGMGAARLGARAAGTAGKYAWDNRDKAYGAAKLGARGVSATARGAGKIGSAAIKGGGRLGATTARATWDQIHRSDSAANRAAAFAGRAGLGAARAGVGAARLGTSAAKTKFGRAGYNPSQETQYDIGKFALGKFKNKIIRGEGLSVYKKPSFFRYLLAYTWAFIGWVFGLVFSFLIFIGLIGGGIPGLTLILIEIGLEILLFDIPIYIVLRQSMSQIKIAGERSNELIYRIRKTNKQIQFIATLYTPVLKYARTNKYLAKPARRIGLRVAKLRKAKIVQRPLTKFLRRTVFASIKFLDLLPWLMIGVYSVKKAHKEAYKQVMELQTEYEQSQIDLINLQQTLARAQQAYMHEQEELQATNDNDAPAETYRPIVQRPIAA